MPSNLVKSYAKKSGKSVASVESAWKKAKRAVSKSYDPETNPNAFYGTVNKILRRKLNLEENRRADGDSLLSRNKVGASLTEDNPIGQEWLTKTSKQRSVKQSQENRTAKRFAMRRMNESADEETIVQAIGKYFDYSLDFEFQDVVEDIIDSALEDIEYRKRKADMGTAQIEPSDAVANALDARLIYYKEQWAVLRHYCTPQDANWERAEEALFNDVLNIVTSLLEDEETEEPEGEEPEDEELNEKFKRSEWCAPSVAELAKSMKDGVDWLVENGSGCCHWPIYRDEERGNIWSIVMGWSEYDGGDENVYFEDGYTIRVGIRYQSERNAMQSDYDVDFTIPETDDGDAYDISYSVERNEDFKKLASDMLAEGKSVVKDWV